MSKQTSLVTFKGRMGGISFFERKGVPVARKATGTDRNRILNDPKFERIRENMSEFSALVMATSFQSIFQTVDNVETGQSVNAIIKRAAARAGILKNVSAHTLRHSFAPHLPERGTALRYIQALLGHDNSKTTERYTHVTKKGFEKLMSPLDSLFSKNVLNEGNADI